jgi:hypothetical protein
MRFNYNTQVELPPWSRVVLEKLRVTQLVEKFPAFCGTQRIITVFTAACHCSLPSARCIQSTPYIPKIHSEILSSTPRSSEWSFRFGFSNQSTVTFLICPLHATCPTHRTLPDLICCSVIVQSTAFSGLSKSLHVTRYLSVSRHSSGSLPKG